MSGDRKCVSTVGAHGSPQLGRGTGYALAETAEESAKFRSSLGLGARCPVVLQRLGLGLSHLMVIFRGQLGLSSPATLRSQACFENQ